MTIKKLCLILLLLLLTAGCNIVNRIRMVNANDHLVAAWPGNEPYINLETEYIGEKPYVYASINGVSGFKFLVDTGASITILQDTEKVKALKLTPGYELSMSGWGDEEDSQGYQTVVDTLHLSGVGFEKVNIAYLPTSKTKYFLRSDEAIYDGVLGHDILKHFNWRFDKKANQITLSRQAYPMQSKVAPIPIDEFFSKLYIDGEMAFNQKTTISHELIIDTGSRHYIKLNAGFLENESIPLPAQRITAADFGLNGRAIHQRIRLASLHLGELEISDLKANLIKAEDEDDFWVIGNALLNQFISIIDYQNHQLYLIPYDDQLFRTRFNLLGLELRKVRSGAFVVRYVLPDMAAANQDFQEGDLITSINGVSAEKISQEQWLELSATPGHYEICRLRETRVCLNLRAKHIPGYSIAGE